MRDVAELFGAWSSYYVMMGSSAAALTGLMFVVVTLVRDAGGRPSEDGLSTFSTPTVYHFCAALFTSALMAAPLRAIFPVAIVLTIAGAAGLLSVGHVARRAATLKSYRPDAEDWIWNVAMPAFAYALLIAGAFFLHRDPAPALYLPATAVGMLIFAGIHNAWDVVTFLATGKAAALPDVQPERTAENTE